METEVGMTRRRSVVMTAALYHNNSQRCTLVNKAKEAHKVREASETV